ncbi:RIP metalloprotease RseP [Streptococcus zalophi]|uniref:Zinc metalloprotease n=1 Tax=Streptococcus zalophi TaxID=640031 RepID=A0A934PB44_9STRE|nr:RIP metalloprotease RseP [Streptococcus zalophi]MBJ8350136.1 RIP metalloprotease RseP [Streptococcus zalophi]MCR8968176.1 RIP metalloprotease RseP [Streptococcus zalophi]
MTGILTFIFIFGVIVVIHEYGHLYFAKKSGILVREFSIGMGPKIFAHRGKDGTTYTIRLLPLGGYVRMAGWGDDKTDIKTGTLASLEFNDSSEVTRINLSNRSVSSTSLPMNIVSYDLEDKLEIAGLVLEETKTFKVNHNATIIEEDGTEVLIAPKDVQYQNASIPGRMMTNFAGPMNNFILGIVVFVLLAFVQGGVPDETTNRVQVMPNGPLAQAGVVENSQILAIEGKTISNWQELTQGVDEATKDLKEGEAISLVVKNDGEEKIVSVVPEKQNNTYFIGVTRSLKTSFTDKLFGGFQMAYTSAFAILNGLKNLIFHPDINKLGGPVAIYQLSNQAAASGFSDILYLMAMLSMNLGILNLVPIPALDGGKIVMNIIEAIRRKPLKQETEMYITLAGVVFMVILMISVTWNDILRTFF